jgi:8-oxo-dGTP pyrophosphatase MutT (NUDIX family)
VADLSAVQTVRAAGGVVWRTHDGTVEVLVVHRPRYDDWSFPKGKADGPDETDEQTARREVEEETGLACELGPELASTAYVDHLGRPKTVRYWAMTAHNPDAVLVPNHEVDEMEWLPPVDAARRLTYPRELPVLQAFIEAR